MSKPSTTIRIGAAEYSYAYLYEGHRMRIDLAEEFRGLTLHELHKARTTLAQGICAMHDIALKPKPKVEPKLPKAAPRKRKPAHTIIIDDVARTPLSVEAWSTL